MEKPTQQQSLTDLAKESLLGQTETFLTPSGYNVTIRELNGNDEDILSNKSTAADLTNLRILLSEVIIDTDLPMAINGKLNIESAKDLLLRDMWFIILKVRTNSYGNLVKLKYDWGKKNGGILDYEENLERYIWDYSKPFPEEGDPNYDPERIKPYNKNSYGKQTLTLSNQKKIRFNFLDGHSQSYLINLPIDQQTRNTELKARNIELFHGDDYVKIENFTFFKRNEMAELHKFFNENDTTFAGLTEIEHPTTKEMDYLSIMSSNDFFYPGEI